MPLYHYVIVRSDLPLGLQAAQIAHAAAQSSHGLHDGTTHAVVLTVPDEANLLNLWHKFRSLGIKGSLIADSSGEIEGFFPTNCMAIGLVPTADRTPIRKLTSHLPLLRSVSERLRVPVNPGPERESVGQTNGGTPCTPSSVG